MLTASPGVAAGPDAVREAALSRQAPGASIGAGCKQGSADSDAAFGGFRTARRQLAGLIFVIALKLGPDVIGFAGFCEACPWLSFAPFDLGLAIGPLLWLQVRRLPTGALPAAWWRHQLPAALQRADGPVMLPLAVKDRWNERVHEPWIDPAETVLEACSNAWVARRLPRPGPPGSSSRRLP